MTPKRLFQTFLFLSLLTIFIGESPVGKSAVEKMGFGDTRWDEMVQAVETMSQTYDGEVGIFIKDLKTGKTFELNPDKKFLSASLIKLPIMAAALKGSREGKIRLENAVTMRNKYRRGGSGKLKWAQTGKEFGVANLIYRMITESDNTATAILIDKLGYSYLNKTFEELGLYVTRIDPVGMSLADHIHPARENYTTPREMAYLLEKLYKREVVSDGMSDLMVEILKEAGSPSRLRRYLPDNWDFARKTGLLRKNCHDVGILYTERSDYIICVLTQKNKTYRKAKGFIASVGKSAYQVLGHS